MLISVLVQLNAKIADANIITMIMHLNPLAAIAVHQNIVRQNVQFKKQQKKKMKLQVLVRQQIIAHVVHVAVVE
jgi:hypothetical protein